MIDFTAYSDEELRAKGQYSIVRQAHEKEKERMAKLTGQMQSVISTILRIVQPIDSGTLWISTAQHEINIAKKLISEIEECATNIADLQEQREELKDISWR